MPTRHAPRRVDGPQKAIMKALRAVGQGAISVISTADLGQGFPDLVVGMHGKMWLVEVKTGSKAPSQQRLTPKQQAFIEAWNGPPVVVLTSAEAAEGWARSVLHSLVTH